MRITFVMPRMATLNAWFFHRSAAYLNRLPEKTRHEQNRQRGIQDGPQVAREHTSMKGKSHDGWTQ
jgi:hypothetical protein